jgi:hypothetical protein
MYPDPDIFVIDFQAEGTMVQWEQDLGSIVLYEPHTTQPDLTYAFDFHGVSW